VPVGGRTKTEPTDLNVWRALVRHVVVALATGPGRVRWFEAWNGVRLRRGNLGLVSWAGSSMNFPDSPLSEEPGDLGYLVQRF